MSNIKLIINVFSWISHTLAAVVNECYLRKIHKSTKSKHKPGRGCWHIITGFVVVQILDAYAYILPSTFIILTFFIFNDLYCYALARRCLPYEKSSKNIQRCWNRTNKTGNPEKLYEVCGHSKSSPMGVPDFFTWCFCNFPIGYRVQYLSRMCSLFPAFRFTYKRFRAKIDIWGLCSRPTMSSSTLSESEF